MTVLLAGGKTLLANGHAILVGASTGGGSTATLTPGTLDTRRVFQRDVATGNPTGFSTTWNRGWGSVQLSLSASAASTGTLYARLHDAGDSAAVAATVGTGAVLQAALGLGSYAIGTAATAITITLPAGPKFFYVDLSLAADMSNAVRVGQPIGVGSITAFSGQSIAVCFVNSYPNTENMVSEWAGTIPAGGVIYAPATPSPSVSTSAWINPQSSTAGYNSSFGAEYLTLKTTQLGVVCALVGHAAGGQPILYFDPVAGVGWTGLLGVMAHCGWKFDTFVWCQGSTDARNWPGGPRYKQMLAQEWAAIDAQVTAAATARGESAIAYTRIIMPIPGATGPSSSAVGEALADWQVPVEIIRGVCAAYAAADGTGRSLYVPAYDMGGAGIGNTGAHPDYKGRINMARDVYRADMMLRGVFTKRQGPRLTGAATRTGTTIRLTVAQDLGSALIAWFQKDQSTARAATSAELTTQFQVFPQGQTRATGTALSITGVSLVSATEIDITLASDPGSSVALDVLYRYGGEPSTTADRNGYAANYGRDVAICDDQVDGDGFAFGRQLRGTYAPIAVPAPSPATQSISITSIGTTAGIAEGGSYVVAGTFAGPLPTGIDLAIDGAAYATLGSTFGGLPVAAVSYGAGTWSVTLPGAPSAGSHTIKARLTGTAVDSGTATSFTTSTIAALLTAAGLSTTSRAFHFDASQLGSLWTDTARSVVPPDAGGIQGVTDLSGSGNHMAQGTATLAPWLRLGQRNGLPGLECIASRGQYLATLNATLAATLKAGSFTVLAVFGNSLTSNPAAAFGTLPGGYSNMLSIGANAQNAMAARAGNSTPYSTATDAVNWQNFDKVTTGRYPLVAMVARFDASTGIMRMQAGSNAEISTTGTTTGLTTGTAWTACTLGKGLTGIGGWLHEVIVFLSVLSDADRDALLAYAAAKWGT